MSDRIEQSSRLRAEPPPMDSTIVVRGGRDTLEKLSTHVARSAALWDYNGEPLHGISVFCDLDAVGPASLAGVLSTIRTYREVYFVTVGAVAAAGYELLSTGKRPHFTLHNPHRRSTIDLQDLLDLLGEPQRNPFCKTGRTS